MIEKIHTLETLEELVIYGKSPLTRMLALEKLKRKHYNSVIPSQQLQYIREILELSNIGE